MTSKLKKGRGLILFSILIFGCSKHSVKLVWHEENSYRWASLIHNAEGVGFKKLGSDKTGVTFINHLSD